MPIDSEQNVAVLGLGYIGLPTAALIARSGNKVTGVDVSQHVVDYLMEAPSPILLFVLTFIGSMIPIVGAVIVYVPVGLFMLANGNTTGGIGVIVNLRTRF